MRLTEAWSRVWFSPFDPLPLALCRIAMGTLLIFVYLALFPNWSRFYAVDGMTAGLPPDIWNVFYWTDGFVDPLVFWCVGIAASIAFLLGYRTRIAAILLYLLQVSMIHQNRAVVNGEDLILRVLLLYACFAPMGAVLSLDHPVRRAPGRHEIWPVRLMQIAIVLVYAFSLPIKLVSDPAWLNGDLMYWVLVSDTWSRFPWPQLAYHQPVTMAMTYSAVLAEACFPILIWFRRTCVPTVLVMAAFHLGIAVMLKNVTFFSLAMVVSFLLFVPADVLRKLEVFR